MNRTIKNPRWWIGLPIILPLVLILATLALTAYITGWVGHFLGWVSNRINYSKLPKWLENFHDWVFDGR